MKSHYFFEKENNYLSLTVSGEYDFDDFVTYLKIIYAKCEEEGVYKMIFNALAIKGIDVPTIERYYLGVETAEQLKYKVKLAVIWHKEYTNYVAATVAVSRGGIVAVFESVQPALDWLLTDGKE